ncbi:hypothetical protein SU69_06300 [Thermosipho melanesiensis]|uniref:Impact N-terminal domain-containing protein n=2 Tax=Thermosipho melanesiensis TaxID=46541 RepID=A6LME3_THEM4|nr:YigZ family protein [Thermosipho melanesiensis]ABR31094.1 protein of unknown function UPF0029 [Thermosipho melanesiensis BI429]APT74189.1 hypothetical protein BW47_06600 [Thermosipho melanesiensis]OOC36133.1 hypothetical protein SU68_06370 [Thermosipho melanesiensis]OOC36950.1 hypothetical protein SU69_06300 [Thermosipho melanesiensis]OOC37702.1 hypothetical protein SU70_06310 [Thermosipho melanesiensis]
MNGYKTIFGIYEGKKNIKRSQFIATFSHVESVKEAKSFIREISKKYNDATHNCPAYRVMENKQIIEFSSDNGEPSGTAGRPILGALKKFDLLNVAVVVTRYFGGVKLGVRGLIDAYSSIVEETLKGIKIVKLIPVEVYKLKVPYEVYGKAMQELHYLNFEIINTEYKGNFAYITIKGNQELEGYEIVEKKKILFKEE